MSAGLSVISRLAEEFDERSQVFGYDAKFLVDVKSGQVEASLDPDRELRRLKQIFEAWKKDYGMRLRETKVILNKLGTEEGALDRVKKKWWGRRNSTRGLNLKSKQPQSQGCSRRCQAKCYNFLWTRCIYREGIMLNL